MTTLWVIVPVSLFVGNWCQNWSCGSDACSATLPYHWYPRTYPPCLTPGLAWKGSPMNFIATVVSARMGTGLVLATLCGLSCGVLLGQVGPFREFCTLRPIQPSIPAHSVR